MTNLNLLALSPVVYSLRLNDASTVGIASTLTEAIVTIKVAQSIKVALSTCEPQEYD